MRIPIPNCLSIELRSFLFDGRLCFVHVCLSLSSCVPLLQQPKSSSPFPLLQQPERSSPFPLLQQSKCPSPFCSLACHSALALSHTTPDDCLTFILVSIVCRSGSTRIVHGGRSCWGRGGPDRASCACAVAVKGPSPRCGGDWVEKKLWLI